MMSGHFKVYSGPLVNLLLDFFKLLSLVLVALYYPLCLFQLSMWSNFGCQCYFPVGENASPDLLIEAKIFEDFNSAMYEIYAHG